LSMVSDFNENWYLGIFEVRNWLPMMKLAFTCPNSDMGVVWGLLCLHPNTIKPSYYFYYYYYYYSSSSPNEFIQPNPQRLMIRSLLNFTERWIPSQKVQSGLGIFKMALLPWKPWRYINIFDLTYIGNYRRDFHQTWHKYLVPLVEYSHQKQSRANGRHFQDGGRQNR
jgi:hypothetical protein